MYGHIHMMIRTMVLDKFGEGSWKKVLDESGMDDVKNFKASENYTDEATMSLLRLVAGVTGKSVPTLLEWLGEFYLRYHLESSNKKLVLHIADNFVGYIESLDSLHDLMSEKYSEMVAPSFRCEFHDPGDVTVHYYTSRKGFFPMVKGLLKAIALELFGLDVEVERLGTDNKANLACHKEHVSFSVTLSQKDVKEGKSLGVCQDKFIVHPGDDLISREDCSRIFPFHLVFDEQMLIKQMGTGIQKLCNIKGDVAVKMGDIFTMKQPNLPLKMNNIIKFNNSNFILEGTNRKDKNLKITLKGQMVHVPDEGLVVFVASPHVFSLNDMFNHKLALSDIPLHDATRDAITAKHQNMENAKICKILEETQENLQMTSVKLEQEKKKKKGEFNLYRLLPPQIADQLNSGSAVKPRKYDSVTLMLCDIPVFGDVLPRVKPQDSVKMLNELYNRFDILVDQRNGCKVNCASELYLAAFGLPEPSEDSTEQAAIVALEMTQIVKEVLAPIPKKQVAARINLATGPVIAGVVGERIPRYCIFGEALAQVGIIKAHGYPGKIQICQKTQHILESKGFKICEPRDILVAEDFYTTYFLYGYKDREYDELKCSASLASHYEKKLFLHKSPSATCSFL